MSSVVGGRVDEVLQELVDRLRPHCTGLSEAELADLARDLFLEAARFGAAWAEGETRKCDPPDSLHGDGALYSR